MTVVVALKSAAYLQPRGRQLEFEPGIVMTGDTRVSYLGRRAPSPEDDHVKVDGIGDFAIAGYAGNSLIATTVLGGLEEAVIQEGNFDPKYIASLAQRLLVKEDSQSRLSDGREVQILLGIRDPTVAKFVLYEMSTSQGFTPMVRDGMDAIGSHGHYVNNIFEEIRDVAAQLPNDPFEGPSVSLKENIAPFLWFLLDKAIESAAQAEGKNSAIGGSPHCVVLHSSGVEVMDPSSHARLRL